MEREADRAEQGAVDRGSRAAPGRAAKGRRGLRKKISPASWIPASAPGAKPPPEDRQPAAHQTMKIGAVELLVEVPLIGVAGELHRNGVVDLHVDAVPVPHRRRRPPSRVECRAAGARVDDLLLELVGRRAGGRELGQLVHVVVELGALDLDRHRLPGDQGARPSASSQRIQPRFPSPRSELRRGMAPSVRIRWRVVYRTMRKVRSHRVCGEEIDGHAADLPQLAAVARPLAPGSSVVAGE